VDTEDEADGWEGVIQRVGRDVLLGGEWRPPGCIANTHLAVVIPFRDRDAHLRIMLRHLIPVLQRQLAHFRIFVVEQVQHIFVSSSSENRNLYFVPITNFPAPGRRIQPWLTKLTEMLSFRHFHLSCVGLYR